AWNLYPETPWNYGLVLPRSIGARTFALQRRTWPDDDQPWVADRVPLVVKATARRIPGWTLDGRGLVQEVEPGPIRSTEKAEEVALIPMGAARLRISAFPVIGSGAGARDWTSTAK
ncbi:MAG: hypothetical protein L6Q38_17510, partial [Nitrospira sp.]|nr:hypothetical protein [Nitrospira sp.]